MPEEKIEVEFIATATQMTKVFERLEQKMIKQEKAIEKIGRESKKSAEMAAGSFNKLEKELKENEAALKKLAIGSKAFTDQKRKVDALRASLAQAKGQIASNQSAISGAFNKGVGQIAQLAAGMVSFQLVVQAVVSVLNKVKQLKLDAAETSRTLEQALADIGQNIGGSQIAPAREMIVKNAATLGTTQEGLANLIGIAISAGAKDLKEAMAIAAATLKLTVGDATKAASLVGGTLDVASLAQSGNFEGALGQLLQVQSQVRSTNLSEFASNIGPGLAAATAQGQNTNAMTTERALEMASVISQILKDPTGSNTATALMQYATRLDKFTPKLEQKMKDGSIARVSQDVIDEFKNTRDADVKLELFRQNAGLANQFLAQQKEGRGKIAISEIVRGSGRALGFEEKASTAIGSIDQAEGFFDELQTQTKAATALLTAERKSAAATQQAEVTGDRGRQGQVLQIVTRALDKANLSGVDWETRKALNTKLLTDEASGKDPIQSGIEVLQKAMQQRTVFGFIPAGGQVSDEDRRNIQIQIEVLKDMRDTLKLALGKPQPLPQNRPKVAPLPAAFAP